MSDIKAETKNDNSVDDVSKEPTVQDKPTPTKNKRGGSKRLSTLERTAQEGEAILKGLNTSVGEVEGRRRTRSSARGLGTTPTPAPSPPKKEKKETPAKGTGRGRGRPKRQDKNNENNADDETTTTTAAVAVNNKKDSKSLDVEESTKMEVDEVKDDQVDTSKPVTEEKKSNDKEDDDDDTSTTESKEVVENKTGETNSKDEKVAEESENLSISTDNAKSETTTLNVVSGAKKDGKDDDVKDSSDSSQDATDAAAEVLTPSAPTEDPLKNAPENTSTSTNTNTTATADNTATTQAQGVTLTTTTTTTITTNEDKKE